MTDAYQTIWLDYGKDWFNARLTGNETSVEYIRADLARPMTVAEAAKVLLAELDLIEPVNAQAKMAVHTWLSNRALSQGGE